MATHMNSNTQGKLEAVILQMPALIKGFTHEGSRRFTVEVSCEEVDSEGDLILQKALLDAAPAFLESGIVDWSHYSEIGHKLGIHNPEFYVIGKPLNVQDLGAGRTAVTAELFKSTNGYFNPQHNMADQVWDLLNREPPVPLFASVYGFAQDFDEATPKAPRYLVKAINWKSLALTRTPVNSNLKGKAEIVTAKAYTDSVLAKGGYPMDAGMETSEVFQPPRSREDLYGDYELHCCRVCPHTKQGKSINIATLGDHFMYCRGMSYGEADLMAHAAMYLARRVRERHYK